MLSDIFSLSIYNFIKARDGQTILVKDIQEALKISNKTVTKKIKFLIENGYIRREGKKFFDLKKV